MHISSIHYKVIETRPGVPPPIQKPRRSPGLLLVCRRWDLNPHERNAHYALNVARLPVSPLRPDTSGLYQLPSKCQPLGACWRTPFRSRGILTALVQARQGCRDRGVATGMSRLQPLFRQAGRRAGFASGKDRTPMMRISLISLTRSKLDPIGRILLKQSRRLPRRVGRLSPVLRATHLWHCASARRSPPAAFRAPATGRRSPPDDRLF
jgi:hypothetical protein